MKKSITTYALAIVMLLGVKAFAQTFPYGINYQAVARDANGNAKANANVPLQFTIAPSTSTTSPVYIETQSANTNSMGQFNVTIGMGTYVGGSVSTFSAIAWQGNTYVLTVQTGTTIIGTQQLMAVPYAMATPNDVPAGSVVAFFGTTPPAGWLLCDGSAVSRTTYARLYAVIGNASGYGDNSTTFNVPDLRGMFMRGVDGSAGNDPDKATRTAQNSGGNTGNNIGSKEADQVIEHNHVSSGNVPIGFSATGPIVDTPPSGVGGGFAGSGGTAEYTGRTGGAETRPKNVYVNYIIKY
jgi:tail collar domain